MLLAMASLFATDSQARASLLALRQQFERAFRPDTAAPGTTPGTPSAGHCAAVAAIVSRLHGGRLFSTHVSGISHWFNLLPIGNETIFADLTGDQFGLTPVRLGRELFPAARERAFSELNEETLRRAITLAERADFSEVARELRQALCRDVSAGTHAGG